MGEMKIIALNQHNPPLRHTLKVKLVQREREEMMATERKSDRERETSVIALHLLSGVAVPSIVVIFAVLLSP